MGPNAMRQRGYGGGAVSATRHLLDLGHRTVHHITGPRDFIEARQRREGWQATLKGALVAARPLIAFSRAVRKSSAFMSAAMRGSSGVGLTLLYTIY